MIDGDDDDDRCYFLFFFFPFTGFILQFIARLCVYQETFFPNILELFSMAQGSFSQHVLLGPFASKSPVVLIKMQILNIPLDPKR